MDTENQNNQKSDSDDKSASPPSSNDSQGTDSSDVPNDKFRQGRIIKYFPQSGYGFVRDETGHEIYFHLDELRFVGPKGDRRYVTEGCKVGIDVGRTSRGLRVTRLKVY